MLCMYVCYWRADRRTSSTYNYSDNSATLACSADLYVHLKYLLPYSLCASAPSAGHIETELENYRDNYTGTTMSEFCALQFNTLLNNVLCTINV